MDVIKETMTDAQMLYTKKDVVELLEQMQEQKDKNALQLFFQSCYEHEECSQQGFICNRFERFQKLLKGE